MVLPPALISPRHQTGEFRGLIVILVGLTTYFYSLEFSFSAPLTFTREALYLLPTYNYRYNSSLTILVDATRITHLSRILK